MSRRQLAIFSFIVSLAVSPELDANASTMQQEANAHEPIYFNVAGTVALENARVLVERYIIQPGQSTGYHVHAAHQLQVFVKGGVLTSMSGRSTVWPDGRVVWLQDAGTDGGSTNTGSGPIELLWVALKPAVAAGWSRAARGKAKFGYLNYPNIPGEDVLENDQVIVQRFKMNPGDWEGIHAHNPNTFYIFIKGGQYVSKSKDHPAGVPGSAVDGAIAWMDTIDLSQEHQSGNTGTNATEVVWVALKD